MINAKFKVGDSVKCEDHDTHMFIKCIISFDNTIKYVASLTENGICYNNIFKENQLTLVENNSD